MLHGLVNFSDQIGPLNVFRYVSFRTGGATMTALLMVFVFGPAIMNRLRGRETTIPFGKRLRPPGPRLASVTVGSLVWSNWSSIYVWIALPAFLLVGSSSAFHVTDRHDGSVSAPIMIVAGFIGLLAFALGSLLRSENLHLPHIRGIAEMMVVCGAMIGAGFGLGSLRDA